MHDRRPPEGIKSHVLMLPVSDRHIDALNSFGRPTVLYEDMHCPNPMTGQLQGYGQMPSIPVAYSASLPHGQLRTNTVQVELENKELWKRFHDIGTEMIITKTGRWVKAQSRSNRQRGWSVSIRCGSGRQKPYTSVCFPGHSQVVYKAMNESNKQLHDIPLIHLTETSRTWKWFQVAQVPCLLSASCFYRCLWSPRILVLEAMLSWINFALSCSVVTLETARLGSAK